MNTRFQLGEVFGFFFFLMAFCNIAAGSGVSLFLFSFYEKVYFTGAVARHPGPGPGPRATCILPSPPRLLVLSHLGRLEGEGERGSREAFASSRTPPSRLYLLPENQGWPGAPSATTPLGAGSGL